MKVKVLIALVISIALIGTNTTYALYSGGTGEPNNPYRIATPNDLNDIGNHVEDFNKCFVMVNDVNLADITGTQFNIIGNEFNAFTGVFDGNGHTVSNFTYINNADYIGLFALIDDVHSEIKGLTLIDPNVDAGTGDCVGALVGRFTNGTIQGCTVQDGSISGEGKIGGLVGMGVDRYGLISNCSTNTTVSGSFLVGGLAGYFFRMEGYAMMSNCSSTGSVSGNFEVGGLVGELRSDISNCYSSAIVSGNEYVGGLIGLATSLPYYHIEISDCNATGDVIATGECVGGLVGETIDCNITDCYATCSVLGYSRVGGLVGLNEGGYITNCYTEGDVNGLDGEVGGLVGTNSALVGTNIGGTIANCQSRTQVTGGNDEGVGGLVGVNSSGSILQCFSNGYVSGVIDVGGLVGYNFTDGNISDSYSFADVNATCCYAGGLVSGNTGTVQRCYSTGMVTVNNNPGGGLVSHSNENVTESFWDIEASGCNNSDGGTGLPTAQMQKEATFKNVGWDFVEVWGIGENQTYPYLRVYPAGDLNHDDKVNLYDVAITAEHWLEEAEH